MKICHVGKFNFPHPFPPFFLIFKNWKVKKSTSKWRRALTKVISTLHILALTVQPLFVFPPLWQKWSSSAHSRVTRHASPSPSLITQIFLLFYFHSQTSAFSPLPCSFSPFLFFKFRLQKITCPFSTIFQPWLALLLLLLLFLLPKRLLTKS